MIVYNPSKNKPKRCHLQCQSIFSAHLVFQTIIQKIKNARFFQLFLIITALKRAWHFIKQEAHRPRQSPEYHRP